MRNTINELHGRIDQRSRQRARGGRHWFAMAKQILHGIPTEDPVTEGATGVGTATAETCASCREYFELTTDGYALEYLNALFDAAVERGLDPLLERRKGQTLLRVICSSVDWASVRMEAMRK